MRADQGVFAPRQVQKITKLHGLPGTGKTTESVQLVKYFGGTPQTVCAETFRRFLAEDLKAKLGFTENPWVSTTHGNCWRVLRRTGDERKLVTEADKRVFCKKIRIPYGRYGAWQSALPEEDYVTESLGEALFAIEAWLVSNLQPLARWRHVPGLGKHIGLSDELVEAFHDEWRAWKEEHGKLDYPDMLWDVYEYELSPELEFLVSDEFQDKTPIQYAIFNEWVKDAMHVIIAGDPFQCIYGFWGTDPAFFEEVPGELRVLPYSYRVPSRIWEIAQGILTQVGYEIPEVETPKGGAVVVLPNRNQLALEVTAQKEAENFFLVRANYMKRKLVPFLEFLGLPFAGIQGIWNRTQVAIYNALVKLARYQRRSTAWGAFAQVDGPPLAASELTALTKFFRAPLFTVTKKGIGKYEGMVAPSTVYQLISPELYKIAQARFIPPSAVLARSRDSCQRIAHALQKFGMLIPERPLSFLGTIHASKGLEADNVFLFDDITYRVREGMLQDPQSEARVFFVGATRARRAVFVVHRFFGTNTYPLPHLTKEERA